MRTSETFDTGAGGVSHRLGRAAGRWWSRSGRTATRQARQNSSTVRAYLWFTGYMWIGLVLSVTATRVTGVTSPLTTAVAIGGGVVLGAWQARHQIHRRSRPQTGPPRHIGLAMGLWLAAVTVTALIVG